MTLTPERRAEIEALLANQSSSWNAMKELELQADKIIPELLAEIDILRQRHADAELRATVLHEFILRSTPTTDDQLERFITESERRVRTALHNLAATSS